MILPNLAELVRGGERKEFCMGKEFQKIYRRFLLYLKAERNFQTYASAYYLVWLLLFWSEMTDLRCKKSWPT